MHFIRFTFQLQICSNGLPERKFQCLSGRKKYDTLRCVLYCNYTFDILLTIEFMGKTSISTYVFSFYYFIIV